VLAELRLENYAVIDNAVIEFASGLNLLTGETGAGKSILIDVGRAGTDKFKVGIGFQGWLWRFHKCSGWLLKEYSGFSKAG